MLTITEVNYEYTDFEVGCTNGNLQPATIKILSASREGKLRMFDLEALSCRCGNGCGPLTDRMPHVGDKFESFTELEDYMDS